VVKILPSAGGACAPSPFCSQQPPESAPVPKNKAEISPKQGGHRARKLPDSLVFGKIERAIGAALDQPVAAARASCRQLGATRGTRGGVVGYVAMERAQWAKRPLIGAGPPTQFDTSGSPK
jgi:hypothetical protein